MSAYLTQAQWLMERRRFPEARQAIGRAIAVNDDDAAAYSLLAHCLLEQDEMDAALAAARGALARNADLAFAHYTLAHVLSRLDKDKEALAAIGEAIRLDPLDADYYAARAGVLIDLSRWREALESAEQGLRLDPHKESCINLRSTALTKLGEFGAAAETLQGALQRNAANPRTHANQGWLYLHEGRHREAMTHFREALRLDPGLEYARLGMIESLKARHWIYRIYLSYMLRMSRLTPRGRWMVLIGFYFAARVAAMIGNSGGSYAPLGNVIVALYLGFVFFTWMSRPLFNLLLFLHPFGRAALSKDERLGAQVVGCCLGLGLVTTINGLALRSVQIVFAGLILLAGSLPAAGATTRRAPRVRKTLGWYAIGLLLIGLIGALSYPAGRALMLVSFAGSATFTILANLIK